MLSGRTIPLYHSHTSLPYTSNAFHLHCYLIDIIYTVVWIQFFTQVRFSENFSQRLRITNQTFRWLFYIHIYVKLPNVFQLLLTTTKLCHIKASSFGEFLHFTRKKNKKSQYLCNSMTNLHKNWHNNAEWVSQVQWLLKLFSFQIEDGGQLMHSRGPFCITQILQFFNFQDGGHPPSWIFKIQISNRHTLQVHILYHYAELHGDWSYHCTGIIIFCTF